MTDESLTPHAGLAIFGEFLKALGLSDLVDRWLPAPGSAVGHRPSRFVLPLILMLHGGGRSLEDLRVLGRDTGLLALLGWKKPISSDAVGDWLRRTQKGTKPSARTSAWLAPLERVQGELLRWALQDDGVDAYTLDIDATQIVAEKKEARWTYKGQRGYMPILGHLAENGLCVGEEFRAGNDVPQARNLEFIEHCAGQLPMGKRMGFLRADSATYQATVINWCEAHGVKYAIGADLDSAVRSAIAAIPESDWRPYQNGHIAETVHSMEKTTKAFRLIVIRRPAQGEMFGEIEPRHIVRVSNREESAETTVAWYNQRGEASENRIKELKLGFGMERMPCGTLEANAVFFRIGVVAYNLFVMFKRMALPSGWRTSQVQTLRWRLYQTAGKVVRHGRQWTLRVSAEAYELLEAIRARHRKLVAGWT